MKFILIGDITTRIGKKVLWLEKGEYPVIRFFDENRVLLDITLPDAPKRQLTVVDLTQGHLLNDTATNPA